MSATDKSGKRESSPEIAVLTHDLPPLNFASGLGNVDRLRELLRGSKSPSTWRAYRSAWSSFEAWCHSNRHVALPARAEVVSQYLAEVSKRLRASSLDVHISGIAKIHKLAGHSSPTVHPLVEEVMAGIRREDRRPTKKAKGLSLADLSKMVEGLLLDRRGLRDRAVLTVGWWGGLRRSEIVALDVDDIEFCVRGVEITIRRSKTDQENVGTVLALPRTGTTVCPSAALRGWLEAAAVGGALFRPVDRHGRVRSSRLTGQSISHIVKRVCSSTNLDAAVASAHSLRRGMITEAVEAGIPEHVVAKHSRHKSAAIKEYIEAGQLWSHSAAVRLARARSAGSAMPGVAHAERRETPASPSESLATDPGVPERVQKSPDQAPSERPR